MNDIPKDQNQEHRLDFLRAQRTYYRRAKRIQTVVLLFALALPFISSFWDAEDHEVRPLLALISIGVLLFDIGWATRFQRDWIKTAARIQEQFDTEVFRLGWNQLVVGSKVDPESVRAVTRAPMKSVQREKLTNWYEQCVGELPLPLGRVVCQRTNITYDMRVRKGYARGCLAIAILLFAVFLFRGVHEHLIFSTLILNVFVPFVPLAAFVLREYRKQSDAVETLTALKSEVEKLWAKALKNPRSADLDQDSRNLQDAIYRNRTSNTLVYDWVYWLSRKLNEDSAHHAAKTLVVDAQHSLTETKEVHEAA